MNNALFSPQVIKRIFASGAIGNILETYDLILITLTATTLSKTFFPPTDDPQTHIIHILYVYILGLLVRPLGNIIMSSFADQIGRKKLMVVSLTFTGFGTILIGLLPSYEYIGMWSTTLFLLLRILQNFFAGIEYINSATYLIESSNKTTRGYYGSWTAIGISGGYLLASLVTLITFYLISKEIIPEWSWRFIFLFSFVGIIFGIWLRHSIPESLVFITNKMSAQPATKWHILNNSVKFILAHPKQCFSISALTLLGAFLSFIYYIYIPIYLITNRNFPKIDVFLINVLSLSLIVALIPLFGKLSDYYNRIHLLKIVCCTVALLGMPFFWLAAYGSYAQIITISLLISIPSACFFSLYPVIITERFPAKIRCTTASLVYQIVVSIEMASLPIIIDHTIKITGMLYAPGYLLITTALIGYGGLVLMKQLQPTQL